MMTVDEYFEQKIEHLPLSPVARCQLITKGCNNFRDIWEMPFTRICDPIQFSWDAADEIMELRRTFVAWYGPGKYYGKPMMAVPIVESRIINLRIKRLFKKNKD